MCVILVFDICQRGAGSPAPKATVRNWSCAAGTRLQPASPEPRSILLPARGTGKRGTEQGKESCADPARASGSNQLPQEHIYGPVHKLLYGPVHKQSDVLKESFGSKGNLGIFQSCPGNWVLQRSSHFTNALQIPDHLCPKDSSQNLRERRHFYT